MGVTTIRVSVELRERVDREARVRGISSAQLVEQLLDEHDREIRMNECGHAMRGAEAEYWDEFHLWDGTSADEEPGSEGAFHGLQAD